MPASAKLEFIDDKPAKKCSKCGQLKLLDQFHNSQMGFMFKRPDCKDCVNQINRKQYSNNKNNVLQKNRERRVNQYGISQEDYLKLYKKQDGNCLICKNKFAVLCIDHCHETDKVRGLLCNHCNFGIGHFKNSILLLANAIGYLSKTK